MLDDIRRALVELSRPFSDTRTHYCQVEAAALDESRCALAGAVLDAATLVALLAGLTARFPTVHFEPVGVRVLRAAEPQAAAVGTNQGLATSPLAETFDSYHIPRIRASGEDLAAWLKQMEARGNFYVSGGE